MNYYIHNTDKFQKYVVKWQPDTKDYLVYDSIDLKS